MTEAQAVTIFIGGVFASRDGAVVTTLLGSCVAACVWDAQARVGGMNHFMLPSCANSQVEETPARFGVHAMELVIGEIQKLGGQRHRLQAKVFGGGHVLDIEGVGPSVPEQNIRFIREFMAAEGIPLMAQDLGGRAARQVRFHTDTGKALVKRLRGANEPTSADEREHEREALGLLQRSGGITLFDD